MTKEKQMLNFIIPEELLKQIDDYRFQHRFPSRAAAIKWLIKYALDNDPKPTPEEIEEFNKM